MRPEELEIMAPAGSFESLAAAVEGGADSVYFGIGHLNMRSHSANNFQAEDLPEVMRICRAYGLKAYLTLNITLYGEELDEARRVLDLAKETGVNAVIASDMACILYARQIMPARSAWRSIFPPSSASPTWRRSASTRSSPTSSSSRGNSGWSR